MVTPYFYYLLITLPVETPAHYQTEQDNLIKLYIFQIDLRQIESYYRAYYEKRLR